MDSYERLVRQLQNPYGGGLRFRAFVADPPRARSVQRNSIVASVVDARYKCPACRSATMMPEHGHFRCTTCNHTDHCCEGHGTQPGA